MAVWRAMADGLRKGDGGAHLMTYHPMGGRSSSEWFQNDAQIAFNITVKPAVPTGAGTAILSWSRPTQNTDGSPLVNLAGFVVSYGSGSAALLDKQVSITSASATGAEVSNLSPGYWYFKVSAINAANVQSDFSAIVGKTIQ